jgi:thiol-disulfide isomerase/thioredoxin
VIVTSPSEEHSMLFSRFTLAILLVAAAFVVVGESRPVCAADAEEKKPMFASLKQQFDAEIAQWNSQFDLANDGVDLVERYDRWPVWEYLPKFMRVAEQDLQGNDTIDVAIWVRSLPVNDLRVHNALSRILELIEKRWMQHERIPELLVAYNGHISGPSEQFVRSCLEENRRRVVRGLAHVTLALQLRTKAEVPDRLPKVQIDPRLAVHLKKIEHPEWIAYVESIEPEKARQEATELLESANAEFANVTYPEPRLAFENRYVTVAQYIAWSETGADPFARMRILQRGTEAPAIEGVDLNGQQMSLAEFRGSVVVIDFWASWCPPCLAQLDDLKRVATKYRDGQVCFVGFNVDSDASEAHRAVKDEGIPWRSWHIANDDERREFVRGKYQVLEYPWVIVLDKNGSVWFNSFTIDESGKPRSSSDVQIAALDSAIQSCLNRSGTAADTNAAAAPGEP